MTKLTSTTLATMLALAPLPLTLISVVYPTAIMAQTLPNPYVSRALDAVMLPIDGSVISAFGLAKGETGVLVLAVQPGGIADAIGVDAGDVISAVAGYEIAEPIDLDVVVYYFIEQGIFDFVFDGWRAGTVYTTSGQVSYGSYSEVIEMTTIATWTSYSYESFSYSEFYSEYSEVITESYETSESYIEETVTSEEFTSEMASEQTDTEMAAADSDGDGVADDTEDSDGDGTLDGDDTDDDNDGVDDADDSDDNGDGSEDGSVDAGTDAGADEGGDDGADEGGDEGADEGGDEGGDGGGDE